MTPRARLTRTRGATLVEYTLILVAVLLLAAGSWKLLGGKLGTRSGKAGDVVAGDGAQAGGGGGKGGGGGGGGGAKTGGDKSNVASKVSVGGVGGANGEQGGSTRDTSSETNAGGSGGKDSGGNADVTETFTPKRWMGIGLLAAGVLAILYVVSSMRRTKKAADDAGPRDGPSPTRKRKRK